MSIGEYLTEARENLRAMEKENAEIRAVLQKLTEELRPA